MRHLHDELIQNLKETDGLLTFHELAQFSNNIIDPSTIWRHFSKLEGYSMRKTRLLPQLNRQSEQARLTWAEAFWIFWKSARCLQPSIIILLTHMDEKWFYVVRTRTNKKVVISEGLLPKDRKVHHKSHVGKEMYIAVTAFQPHGNDITQGGKAMMVSLVRVGRMVAAKKNSYKRVYRADGTYHYPQIATNILRRKGDLYFKSEELTGRVMRAQIKIQNFL